MQRLFELKSGEKNTWMALPGANHNDACVLEEYWTTIDEWWTRNIIQQQSAQFEEK